jgi:hypothetical protein
MLLFLIDLPVGAQLRSSEVAGGRGPCCFALNAERSEIQYGDCASVVTMV